MKLHVSHHLATRRRPSRPLAAMLFAAVLVLGSAAHLWHHATDPGCAGDSGPHPCTQCSGLHGAIAVPEANITVTPAPAATHAVAARIVATPAGAARLASAPRAPPLG